MATLISRSVVVFLVIVAIRFLSGSTADAASQLIGVTLCCLVVLFAYVVPNRD